VAQSSTPNFLPCAFAKKLLKNLTIVKIISSFDLPGHVFFSTSTKNHGMVLEEVQGQGFTGSHLALCESSEG
jgi:hypothetical protein